MPDQVANGRPAQFPCPRRWLTTISRIRQGHGRIQRRCYPAIHLMNDVDARLMQKVRIQHHSPVLSAEPFVHNDDPQVLEIREKDRGDVCTMTLSSLCAGIRTVTLGGGFALPPMQSGRSYS